MGLITNLVEQCSANAEAMNSNSVDALNFFSGFICVCLNCDYNSAGQSVIFTNLLIIKFSVTPQDQVANIQRHC